MGGWGFGQFKVWKKDVFGDAHTFFGISRPFFTTKIPNILHTSGWGGIFKLFILFFFEGFRKEEADCCSHAINSSCDPGQDSHWSQSNSSLSLWEIFTRHLPQTVLYLHQLLLFSTQRFSAFESNSRNVLRHCYIVNCCKVSNVHHHQILGSKIL